MKQLLCLISLLCLSILTFAQGRVIKGRVTDDAGAPLQGVSVIPKGTKTGVQTDKDGNFTISIAGSGSVTLEFSYAGHKPTSITTDGATAVMVQLEKNTATLEDVVVVGYTTARRRDLAGSVSSINAKQIKDVPLSSAAEAIQGRLAGVQVTASEGAPGADIIIRVRGGGSITQDNSPLYIVDGVQVINGIESIAYDRGYNVIISQTRESYEREVIDLQYLASRSVDGLLISLSTETNDLTHLKGLHAKGLPIVFFDRITEEINTHRVIVDNFKGAFEATEHLIKNGHRRIAVISNSEFLSITHERVAGYKEALIRNGIQIDEDYVQHCFYGGMIFEEIEDAVNKLFTLRNKPEAIFTTSDKLTTGCLKTLKRRGLKVPDDVSLVGFSNSDIAELLDPPLTVVRQPAYEMGKDATELLLQLIDSKRPVKEFEKRVLTPELQIRESSVKRVAAVAPV